MPSEGKRPWGEVHPDERPVAPHCPEDKTDDEDFICDECKAVDWSSLPDLVANGFLKHRPYLSEPLRSVNATAEQLQSSPCKVCRILSIIVAGAPDHKSHYSIKALPVSTFAKGYRPDSKYDSEGAVLSAYSENKSVRWESSRYIAVIKTMGDKHSFQAKNIIPNSIPLNELRRLVDYCQKNHTKCCKSSSTSNLSGLKVIDVWTRTVICAPYGCSYLALSYVWGDCKNDGPVNDLEAPPPVIEDAIQFTISMEHKYLWIDRYVST